MGALPAGGAMVAVEATEEEVARERSPARGRALARRGQRPALGRRLRRRGGGRSSSPRSWREQGPQDQAPARSATPSTRRCMEPMLEEFGEVAEASSFAPPQIPIVSNLTGELLTAEQAARPRLLGAPRARAGPLRRRRRAPSRAQGASTFLELGPDAVLCAMARECLRRGRREPLLRPDAAPRAPRGRGAARRPRRGPHRRRQARLGARFFAGTGASGSPLPTYPFQRQRYWLDGPRAGRATSAPPAWAPPSTRCSARPIALAGEEGWLFTGRLSLADPPLARRPRRLRHACSCPAPPSSSWPCGAARGRAASWSRS